MSIIFSGMQPSGSVHLGNYFSMIEPLKTLTQDSQNKIICSIADLHAITIWQDPHVLSEHSLNLAAFLIASGLDTENSYIYLQSSISQHTELAWLLSCTAKIGWLNRMTQFKSKAGKQTEQVTSGLYFYPVLMAADILLYDTNIVPVGEDQKQHLEFARDVAICFNGAYNVNAFIIPEPFILPRSRIMSLKDGTVKMSKSDPAEYAKILFSDSDDLIAKKISKSKTDSFPISGTLDEIKTRPEAYNLLNIYSMATHSNIEAVLEQFSGKGFAVLKRELTEVLINLIHPLRIRYNALIQEKSYLMSILHKSSQELQPVAKKKIQQIHDIIGFVNLDKR